MKSVEFGPVGVERRRYAVEEIRFSMARLYRGFVLWASLYGDVRDAEERERRERVDELLDGFTRSYLPRSMWLTDETQDKIEDFTEGGRELRARLSAEIEERGYERTRFRMARRVSKKLGPMRKRVDSALEAELTGPRPPRWRATLRRR